MKSSLCKLMDKDKSSDTVSTRKYHNKKILLARVTHFVPYCNLQPDQSNWMEMHQFIGDLLMSGSSSKEQPDVMNMWSLLSGDTLQQARPMHDKTEAALRKNTARDGKWFFFFQVCSHRTMSCMFQ